jgi:hypothetical protein
MTTRLANGQLDHLIAQLVGDRAAESLIGNPFDVT